jgi:hypothetical protein
VVSDDTTATRPSTTRRLDSTRLDLPVWYRTGNGNLLYTSYTVIYKGRGDLGVGLDWVGLGCVLSALSIVLYLLLMTSLAVEELEVGEDFRFQMVVDTERAASDRVLLKNVAPKSSLSLLLQSPHTDFCIVWMMSTVPSITYSLIDAQRSIY